MGGLSIYIGLFLLRCGRAGRPSAQHESQRSQDQANVDSHVRMNWESTGSAQPA